MTLLDLRTHDVSVVVSTHPDGWRVVLSVGYVVIYHRTGERPLFGRARDAAFAAETAAHLARNPLAIPLSRARDLFTCLAVIEQQGTAR